MSKPSDLMAYLFEGRTHLLARPLGEWMESSPRFTAFVEIYRDKIRKKLRANPERESLLDLKAEMEVAARLLKDRRFEVAYEPYASARLRGADFAVTYRTNLVFNVEVARLRGEEGESSANSESRILRVVLGKLGQMHPNMPNLLVLHVPETLANTAGLEGWMRALKTRVESKDQAFLAAAGYNSASDFYRSFLRLSAILLWAAEPRVWVNRQARPALDEKVTRLVSGLLGEKRPL